MSDASTQPFVSVIIPVYNDRERLETCLAALERQTYPRNCYEVIVVDNGSRECVAPTVARFPQARAACEPTPGSYVARNTGVALSRGEVLAFTDSDCLPAPDWIEAGVAALRRLPGCGMVGGRVDLFYQNPDNPTAVELYDKIVMGLQQRRYIESGHYGATANVFTWRRVFDRVGPFDAKLRSSGDNEWGQRVYRAGLPQAFADEARVGHPARSSLRDLCRKVVRVTGGHQDVKRKNGYTRAQFMKDVARDVLACRVFLDTLHEPNLPGVTRKAKFLSLVFLVKYLRAYERVRIQLGGRSSRG
jgi:glycosyltransferase involved in cell wall biosynthesis